jgi:hypothetical protein
MIDMANYVWIDSNAIPQMTNHDDYCQIMANHQLA